MEIIQVEFPFFKTIPTRKARPGQVLEGEVYGKNDQFIADRGTEIDDHLLTRFENFDVRRVVIREKQETWITDDSIGGLPTDAQVIERRSVWGPLADHTRELFGESFDRTMRELVQEGQKEAEDRDRPELVQELEDERQKIEELEERLASIREGLADFPEKTRKRIRNVIQGTVLDLGRDFLQLPAAEGRLRKCLQFFKDRDRARNQLIGILSEYSDIFEEVERDSASNEQQRLAESVRDLVPNGTLDQVDETIDPADRVDFNQEAEGLLSEQNRIGRELIEESLNESVGRKLVEASSGNILADLKTLVSVIDGGEESLPQRVQELLERRRKLRQKVHAALNQENVDHEGEEEENGVSTDSVKKLFDEFDAGRRKKAVQATIGFLRKQEADTDGYEERFAELYADLKDLENENRNLHDQVKESARNPEDREYLEELMDGQREFDPDRLLEMDVDMMLMENIESHLKEQENVQDRFEDLMWDVKTDERIKK